MKKREQDVWEGEIMRAFYVEEVEKVVAQAYAEKRNLSVTSFPWSDDPAGFVGQSFYGEIEIVPNAIVCHDEKGYHLAETADDIIKYLEEKGLKALRKEVNNG